MDRGGLEGHLLASLGVVLLHIRSVRVGANTFKRI